MESVNVLSGGRADPGIIILNLKNQVTFANQIAWEICKCSATGRLSVLTQVRRLCKELKSRLDRFALDSPPDSVCLTKIVPIGTHLFTLSGLSLSTQDSIQSTHFLILLDKVTVRNRLSFQGAQSHFKLTPREFQHLQLLVQGHPNKEIANKLDIAESTVKKYVRKVMAKVGTASRTRAEVVSKVLPFSNADNLNPWPTDFSTPPKSPKRKPSGIRSAET